MRCRTDDEILEKHPGGCGDFRHCLVEHLLIHLGRFGESAYLPDELERCIIEFRCRGKPHGFAKPPDIPAHGYFFFPVAGEVPLSERNFIASEAPTPSSSCLKNT